MDIVLTYIVRIVFKNILRRHISSEKNVTRVVVISEKDQMEKTVRYLTGKAEGLGYRIVRAYCADEDSAPEGEQDSWYIGDVHIHYGIQDLTSRLITDPFDEVFINTPNIPQTQIQDIILGFEEMGVTTHYNIELPSVTKAATQVEEFMGYSVISYNMNRVSYKRLFIKRIIDIIGGTVGLILTGIITIFLAPAIKLDSPGPVFFSQVRVGKNGRRFKIYKFRSMYIDAEERKKELESENEMNGLMFKMENDPRVTKVGAFIRKTSLDEFPQFLNVLKGDMSLVGTRPPTEAEFEQYNEHYRRRLSMTPGLTGLWQISGRSDIQDFDEVVKLDLQYIDNWSLTEDFKILIKTVGVVLFGKGAK
jgi:exopolysaccharide biosynthesis polyprenyl glycosylphosphotransferase